MPSGLRRYVVGRPAGQVSLHALRRLRRFRNETHQNDIEYRLEEDVLV